MRARSGFPALLAVATGFLPTQAFAQLNAADATVLAGELVATCSEATSAAGGGGGQCRELAGSLLDQILDVPIDIQEIVGLALANAVRGVPAVGDGGGALQDLLIERLMGSCSPAVAAEPIAIESCLPVVRVIAIASQALPPPAMADMGEWFCTVMLDFAPAGADIPPMIAALQDRATAGGDPVMTSPIEPLLARVMDCATGR